MSWEIVMGLEVHAELSTQSKIFCGCSTKFGAEPNTQVCVGCGGFPGSLPVLNKAVVEYAVRAGLALNCDITKFSTFDRKNYFYPDLPGAYQISQLHAPICRNGSLEIEANGEKKHIGIHQIHMEQDAGKLVHDAGKFTLIDLNRASTPLIEIVTRPDFRSADEVIAYLEKLREILLYLDVCDCKMQEGSFRADVNLSVRRVGEEKLGTRTEVKNINSFKAISRAIEYEAARHIETLEEGGRLVQETRRWDDDRGQSFSMREKANALDYRYFPDPDLLPIIIDDEWLSQIKDSIPELAHEKRERYISDYGVSVKESVILTSHKNISSLFEQLVEKSKNPTESTNLITGELMYLMNTTNTLPEELDINADKLALLISLLLDGKISRAAYKDVVGAIFADDVCPESYINEHKLMMVSDTSVIDKVVEAVVANNEKAVAEYREGKEKAFGFLVGQAMKELGSAGNPEMIRAKLKELL